jgi:hypothetical protein
MRCSEWIICAFTCAAAAAAAITQARVAQLLAPGSGIAPLRATPGDPLVLLYSASGCFNHPPLPPPPIKPIGSDWCLTTTTSRNTSPVVRIAVWRVGGGRGRWDVGFPGYSAVRVWGRRGTSLLRVFASDICSFRNSRRSSSDCSPQDVTQTHQTLTVSWWIEKSILATMMCCSYNRGSTLVGSRFLGN